MRLLATLVLLILLCPAASRADDGTLRGIGLDPESLARLILEDDGPQQALATQALRGASSDTVAQVHAALRRLAPKIVQEQAARGPTPDLAKLGGGPLHVVEARVRFLDADDHLIRDISVDTGGHGLPPAPTVENDASAFTYLDDTMLEVILRAIEKSSRIALVADAKITVYDRQLANASVLSQESFVSDVDQRKLANGAVVVTPVVESAKKGMAISLRPELSKDRRTITLELSLLWAELVKPLAPKSILSSGQTIALTMPTTHLQLMRTTIPMPDQGSALIASGAKSGDKQRYVLITAKHVEMAVPKKALEPAKK